MGNRWSRSMAIARQSVTVLRNNPALMTFPVVSGLVSFAVTVSFFLPLFFAYRGQVAPGHQVPPLAYVVSAIYYLVSYFVVIFFNVGLARCTYATLQGQKPTFQDGIRFATSRLGKILGWTLLSATIGMILRTLAERVGIIGKIVVAILGAAWNVVTFLVIPVLAVENKGPIDSLKESTALLKKTWGEQIIGTGGVSFVFAMAALIPVVPLIAAIATTSIPLIVAAVTIAVLYWLGLTILAASIGEVYRTALYVYATTGTPPNGFDSATISGAFTTRPQGKAEQFMRGKFGS